MERRPDDGRWGTQFKELRHLSIIPPLELALGDIAIRFEAGTEPEYLAALVSALRGRC